MKRADIDTHIFINSILHMLQAKKNKQGERLPYISYKQQFGDEVLNITIEREIK